MGRAFLLATLAAFMLAAPAHGRDGGSACPATVANELDSTGNATQLVTVVARTRTSTRAELRLWRKRGECWSAVAEPWTAWLGRRGTSRTKREGDRTTPAGIFGFGRVMYGVAPNPGVRYRYHRIVCGDWWVEDPRSRYYNQFRHVPCDSTPPFRVPSEELSRSPTAYRHFAFIRYNADPVIPGRGSGIFLHATTGRPTLGCVSLPVAQLVRTLRWLQPSRAPLIAIGTRADFRAF